MIHFIDAALEPFLWFLVDWSLRWAIVIIVLAAWLAIVRPRRTAARYLLSMLALVAGLALPLVPQWGAGFAMAPANVPQQRIVALKPAEPSGAPRSEGATPAERSQEARPGIAPVVEDSPPAKPSPATADAQPSEHWGLRRTAILSVAVCWILGVGFLSVRWLGGWLLLERIRGTAVPVQGASSQLFHACAAQLGLRRPAALASHAAVRSPLTLGLYRPLILIPPSWSELPEQTQRGSLLHELAHLARYDDWTALALELVRIVFFFHPLVHWLIGRIEYERELLCDETAVAHGIDPHDYAGVLLEFSRQPGRLRPAFLGPSYPLRFGHRRTVKARINRLLEANMTRWISPLPIRRAIALATVGLALALGLGSFRVRAIEAEPESPPLQAADGSGPPQKAGEKAQKAPPAAGQKDSRGRGEAYHIEPSHVLKIEVLGAEPAHGINGNFLVEPDGKVDLGPYYGKVVVSNLALEGAEAAIAGYLRKLGFSQVSASVSLAGWVTRWLDDPAMKTPFHLRPLQLVRIWVTGAEPAHPIGGDYLIEPGGKVNLGPAYRRVAVSGLTLESAQEAIEKHLRTLGFQAPKASVTLAGWESDWHDLTKQGARQPAEVPPKASSKLASLIYGNKTFAEWRAVLMSDLKPEVRTDAIKALSALGANGYGREASEAIIEAMRGYEIGANVWDSDDQKVVSAATSAFSKIGSDALPTVIEELKHGKKNGRRFAIKALEGMGRDRTNPQASTGVPKAAAPVVLEAFKDQDPYVRLRAIVSVNPLGVEHDRLLSALTESLKDANPNVRSAAAHTLARMGQSAKPAVPELITAVKDENYNVRSSALVALKLIGPSAQDVLPALIVALKDKEQTIRAQAREYVKTFGPDAKGAVPALIATFNEYPTDQAPIARTLGTIGPAAKEALPTLIEFLEQPQAKKLGAEEAVQEALRKISK